MKHTVNPVLSPQGAYFFQALLKGGLIEKGGLFNLVKRINGRKVSRGRLVVPGRYTAFSNHKKIVKILYKELER